MPKPIQFINPDAQQAIAGRIEALERENARLRGALGPAISERSPSMTETRAKYLASQAGFWGDVAPPAGMSLQDQVGYILEHYPEARADDRALVLRFWEVFDGLRALIGDEVVDQLLAHAAKLTKPETIRRRRQEHQRLRDEGGHLRPDQGTIARRRALDGAGPPKR